jgi:hypothetical protein
VTQKNEINGLKKFILNLLKSIDIEAPGKGGGMSRDAWTEQENLPNPPASHLYCSVGQILLVSPFLSYGPIGDTARHHPANHIIKE